MANENIGENKRGELTDDQRAELARHNYAMDFETALALSRADAVLKLLAECQACECGLPDEIPYGIEAARELLRKPMVRAGIA